MRFLKIEYTKWWTQMPFFEIESTQTESGRVLQTQVRRVLELATTLRTWVLRLLGVAGV